MWVHYQILSICEERTPGNIEAALNKLPKDLGTTYTQILERIDSQSDTNRHMAKEVLRWLLYVQEPCSAETIIQAIAVKPDEATLDTNELQWTVSDVLSICQNLVVNDKNLGNLRFAHLSVLEFLQCQPQFSQQKAHAHMAEVCLTALTYNHLFTPPGLVPALLHYSSFNWVAHVRLSHTGSSTLEKLWKSFLKASSTYNTWSFTVVANDYHLRGIRGESISPLWVACYYQLEDIVGFLLEDGADPNSCNYYRKAPLHVSVEEGYEVITQMLLEKDGVDVNCTGDDGSTPLIFAAVNGHERIVQMLLKKDGVDVNCMSYGGWTPLILAAKNGHERIVQMLLEKDGVNVNCTSDYGWTPLIFAAVNGHERIVQMLLEKGGVDVSCTDKHGWTPLIFVAVNGHERIAQMLLGEDRVDVNCTSYGGWTPLILAAKNDHEKIVQMLLEKDRVDVNYTSDDGWTPLMFAAKNGHEKIVQMLLEKDGVDVNCTDEDGSTPLIIAAENGHKRIIQMLLEKGGVDIDCTSNSGWTPLSKATKNGYEEIVQMLTKGTLDTSSKDKSSRQALL